MGMTRSVKGWELSIARRSFYARGVWYFVIGRPQGGNLYWFSRHKKMSDAVTAMKKLDPEKTLHAIFC